jgi:hypothetical protein
MNLQALNKRMKRLEQSIPPEEDKAAIEARDAAWRKVFKEYGVPLDTPIPNYYPPIIRAVIDADGAGSEEFLSVNGQYVSRAQAHKDCD